MVLASSSNSNSNSISISGNSNSISRSSSSNSGVGLPHIPRGSALCRCRYTWVRGRCVSSPPHSTCHNKSPLPPAVASRQ